MLKVKPKRISNGVKKILLILLVIPFISACQKDKPVLDDNLSIPVNQVERQACLEEAERNYQEKWLDACQDSIKLTSQRRQECENIHLPWNQQGISRDQYCRNTTVESDDYYNNYRDCMEKISASDNTAIDNCIGPNKSTSNQDCVIPQIFLNKLEKEKADDVSVCANER